MKGRVFSFGDDIDTDVIAPGGVLHKGMDELVKHSMEAIFPDFSQAIHDGDVIIAGRNFGCGSSREQAPMVLMEMGIHLVLARSFSRLFFRNAVNVGLHIGAIKNAIPVEEGQEMDYCLSTGEIKSDNGVWRFEGPTGILKEIISDGGLVQYVRKQLENKEK